MADHLPMTQGTPGVASFHNEQNVNNQIGYQIIHGNVNHYIGEDSMSKRSRLYQEDENSQSSLDQEILASLSFPQMTDRRRNIEAPHHQTCEWIYQLKEYQDWSTKTSGLLWIKGKPGAGKSTLMSHLYSNTLMNAERSVSFGSNIYLEFFFTARGVPLERSAPGMLRTLLTQIFHYDPSSRTALRDTYQERQEFFGDTKWKWQQPELEKLLSDMVSDSAKRRQVVIFVDALDEAGAEAAEEIANYFHKLNDLVQAQSGKARICISCRHYPVPPSYRAAVEIHVEKHNRHDISAYVEHYVNNYVHINELFSDSAEGHGEWRDLMSQLATMANGLFQWARLVLPLVRKRISDGDSAIQVRQWLLRIPPGLTQVYQYIFNEVIDQEYKEMSQQLFQWVCFATRPLTIAELRFALAAHNLVADPVPDSACHKSPRFISTDEIMKLRINSWSGGLIEISYSEGSFLPVVQPIHLSVRSFFSTYGFALLARSSTNSNEKSTPLTDQNSAGAEDIVRRCHGDLYWSCLKCIAAEKADSTLPNITGIRYEDKWKRIRTWKQTFSFVDYAVCNILIHAEEAHNQRGQNLRKERSLLEYAIPAWAAIEEFKGVLIELSLNSILTGIISDSTPLHVAAAANMTDLTRYLLESGVDVDARDAQQRTALHVASRRGHTDTAKLLVEAGAKVRARTSHRDTALTFATSSGHPDIVSWLLKRSASHGSFRKESQSILSAAAHGGNLAVIKICIDAGMDVNFAPSIDSDTALQLASIQGHTRAVQMLLEAGADINAESGLSGSALQAAASGGKTEAVKMLLESGADINAKSGQDGTALQAAVSGGHIEVVGILLAAGADVNAQGGKLGNALQAAAYMAERYISAVHMLLAQGAEVNAQGGPFGTALQSAAFNCKVQTTQVLVEAGADVNARGGRYGSALQATVSSPMVGDQHSVARILLDAGAEVNVRHEEHMSPIYAASQKGDMRMVDMLIRAGADVHAQYEDHGTAIDAALKGGYTNIVERLKKAGSDTETPL